MPLRAPPREPKQRALLRRKTRTRSVSEIAAFQPRSELYLVTRPFNLARSAGMNGYPKKPSAEFIAPCLDVERSQAGERVDREDVIVGKVDTVHARISQRPGCLTCEGPDPLDCLTEHPALVVGVEKLHVVAD